MRNIIYICLLMLLLPGLLLAACGGPAPTPTQTSTATPAAKPTPAPAPTPTVAAKPAPTPTAVGPQQYGGILKEGFASTPTVLGYPPLITFGGYVVTSPVLEALFTFDPAGRFQPRLAKGYQISPDRKALTISLREGVKFHDGTDCDAEAVRWNMEQFKVEKVARLVKVDSIDVIDKYTLRLNLKSFSNSLLYDLVMSGGLMVSPTAVKANGKEWAYTHPVGTGPFKFASFQRDVSLKYSKFDGYWQKGKPYLDGVEEVFIADVTVREMAFKKGELQVVRDPVAKNVPDLKAAGYNIKTMINHTNALYPDTVNPDSLFRDKRVREAIEYAIDRKSLARIGFGMWEPAFQVAYTTRMAYVPNLEVREYNPEKAKQLLASAGYPGGFRTKIIATTGADKDMLAALQKYLSDVGIKVDLDICDAGRFNNYFYKGWQNALLMYNITTEPNSIDALYKALHPQSDYTISLYRPPVLGELLDNADIETRYDTLKALCQEVVKYCSQEAILIPVYYTWVCIAEQKTVNGTGIFQDEEAFRMYWNPGNAWISK